MKLDSKTIKLRLNEELNLSYAPVSGYKVVCALVTEKNVYFNHNVEDKETCIFQHAEQNALKEILAKEKSPKIIKIIMYGGGKIKKFKNYTPCVACSYALRPYISKNIIVELLPIQGLMKKELKLKFEAIFHSYREREYSKIEGEKNEVKQQLKSKTILKSLDLEFVSELTQFCLKKGIKLYLTGSSSGRGAASNLIMKITKKKYGDIDLILVTPTNIDKIEREIKILFKKMYGSLKIEPIPIPKHKNLKGVVLKKVAYRAKNSVIDLTFATNVNGAFAYQAYHDRNWYHQLA